MNKLALFLTVLLISLTQTALAAHEFVEKQYQDTWCNANKGYQEVVVGSGERVDCLTSQYAIEFDFSKKYAEAVGQSLLYSISTGKSAGIVLILEKSSDKRYLNRLMLIANRYGIKVWTMVPSDLRGK